MAAQYPSNLVSTSQLPDTAVASSSTLGGTFDHATVHNNLADEMIAVEAELGALPKGAYSTVRARLDSGVSMRDMVLDQLIAWGATKMPLLEGWDSTTYDASDLITLTDQRLTGTAGMVRKQVTTTGAFIRLNSGGTSLASYCGMQLYSMDSSGNWNFVIDTGASDTTIFSPAGPAFVNRAWTSPTVLSPGVVYFLALCAHWTGTAPVLAGVGSTIVNGFGEATFFRNGGKATQTTRNVSQITAASLQGFTNVPYIGAY